MNLRCTRHRAGEFDKDTINEIEGRLATTAGTCAVMGTASTMASLAEALDYPRPGKLNSGTALTTLGDDAGSRDKLQDRHPDRATLAIRRAA